jgi:molybdate transport system substrate-binding protein
MRTPIFALLLLLAATARPEPPLLVFAAASLREAVAEIALEHEKRTGQKIQTSFAASSALARQIEQGAPAAVFISADPAWMDYLQERRRLSMLRGDWAENRLVLIAPAGSAVTLTLAPGASLAGALGERGRLAMADPRHVPAGRYGKAAMERLNLWSSVSGRVIHGDSVRAALIFVARAEAALGVVYATDARDNPAVRVVAPIDPTWHPPIIYPAAVIAGQEVKARQFWASLTAEPAKATLRRHGFIVRP